MPRMRGTVRLRGYGTMMPRTPNQEQRLGLAGRWELGQAEPVILQDMLECSLVLAAEPTRCFPRGSHGALESF